MNEQNQTTFPNNGRNPGQAPAPAGEAVMLAGMKVLFDEKAGLHPVELVAKAPPPSAGKGKYSGQLGRTRAAPRRRAG